MLRRIAVALCALTFVLLPSPAGAVDGHGWMYHGPDAGYDVPIRIAIRWANGGPDSGVYSIPEGTVRTDVAGVYVGAGEEIWCSGALYWDATGWYRVGDAFHESCVIGLD